MKYNQLGHSLLTVSEISLGCMSLKAGNEQENISLIHRAIELGVNFFDTADLYDKGLNEEMVGKAIAAKRNKLFIATKVGNQWRSDGSGWDWNPNKDYIMQAAEESLRRLKINHIDLYQLHGGTIDDPIDDTIEAFETLQQQGKIRYYGISSIRPNVIREYVKRSRITSVMMQYSLADRRPEETILDLLLENDIGVLARGSLAQGLLINKPAKEYLGNTSEQIKAAADIIKELSNDSRTAAQTAIKFVLQNPAISSAVVGVSNMKQLEEVIESTDIPRLASAEMKQLKAALPAQAYEQHR